MTEDQVQYRILGVLGEGGFGKVYRARLETGTGFTREVAVKVLHDASPPESLLMRFRDEARILGLLRDRAIVGVDPPIQLGGRWAVVMDFVDGQSCSSLLSQGRLPPAVALEITEEVARALHNAYHQAGPNGDPLQLLHRDIKPDNIQVTPSGEVCLLDFGIAKANFEEREYKTRQALGGTPGYIAPERLEGKEVPQGDVFSLGVTLHELVTGIRPQYAAPTIQFDANGMVQELDEMEIPEHLRDDPDIRAALELAGHMRTYEFSQRPTAREVENRCRELRRNMRGEMLREWAETHVSPLTDLPQDARTGETLTLGSQPSVVSDDTLHTSETAPVDIASLQTFNRPTPAPPPPRASSGLAMGALLGGGTVVVLGLGTMVVLLVLLVGWLATRVTTPPAEPLPIEGPVPATKAPEAPQPKAKQKTKDKTKEKTKPAPKKAPRVITLTPSGSVAPTPSPAAAPAPAPAPAAAPDKPTGLVVVKTVPSGATVKVRGNTLRKSGRGYRLPPGMHVLEIVSTSGETTRIPVEVRTDAQLDICYSFDTNSRCSP